MNGYQVAEQLRRQEAFENTRLIAVSGYGQEENRLRSEETGFDYYLTKPVDPDALMSLLQSTAS
jgi:CheY-like chemotaxis protein